MLGLIWAQAYRGVIGYQGAMPWQVPEDMAHFVRVTRGHPVIMGRRTWQSLSIRPLPGRRNIVVSRSLPPGAPLLAGAELVSTAHEALEAVSGSDEVWVIGGGELYRTFEPQAQAAWVTELDLDVPGDTYAPALGAAWRRLSETDWARSRSGIRYRFVRWERLAQ